MWKVQLHHPREWMIGMHFLSLFLADISRSKSRGMKLRGLDQAFGTPHRVVSYILGPGEFAKSYQRLHSLLLHSPLYVSPLIGSPSHARH